MMDPYLFNALHNVSNSEQEEDPTLLGEAIDEYVNGLIATEKNESDDLLPPKARHSKLAEEIRSNVNFIEFGDVLSSALNTIYHKGDHYLDEEEYQSLIESLDLLGENLDELDPIAFNNDTLVDAFSIPEEAQSQILQIAIAKFKEGLSEESLALMFFLTLLTPNEPDYWIRLGLLAQKCEKHDLASKAFSAASELQPDFIGTHIFAAECYRLRNMPDLAREELKIAKEISKNSEIEQQWKEQLTDIESLLNV